MKDELVQVESWRSLSRWTSARIAMGRVGASLPTQAVLEFSLDHARARDTIHVPLDVNTLQAQFQQAGFHSTHVWSQARDRAEYLRRPDLGRVLDSACTKIFEGLNVAPPAMLTVVVADGLSSLAPASHALPILERLRAGLVDWNLDSVIVATQARVALGDEIGRLRGAEAVLALIGERPGLKSADSLGAYLTYRPHPGCTDAERNCISNIRAGGLSYDEAVFRLLHLLGKARKLGCTGVALKDDSDRSEVERLP